MTPTTGVTTRSGDKHLKHIRITVLKDTTSKFEQAFESIGLTKIDDLAFFTRDDFAKATYGDNKDQSLSSIDIAKLLKISEWYATKPDKGTIGFELYLQLTSDILSAYVTTGRHPEAVVTSDAKSSESDEVDVVREFRKGIKRDISHYSELKDDSKWNAWKRDIKSIARSHRIENVLDPDYVPLNPIDKALFEEQKTFMFSVLQHKCKTSKSSGCVRSHEESCDAQKCFSSLITAYEKGISQDLNSQHYKLKWEQHVLDSKWRGTIESFLNVFQHKLLDYEASRSSPVSEEEKRNVLTNALQTHTEMQSAMHTKRIVSVTSTGKVDSLNFDQEWDLLMSHAKVIDKSIKAKKAAKQIEVNHAEREKKKREKEKKKEERRQVKLAKAANDSKSTDFIPKEKWAKMTKEQRREHIEAYKKKKQGTDTRQVNAALTEGGTPPPPNPAPTPAAATPEPTPGSELRELLSNRAAQGSSSQTTPVAPGAIIELNGQRFRACNKTYRVSNYSTDRKLGSLIDGGCNGGLAGNDVKVLETTQKTVSVSGIADAKLEDVPIGNVAGLVQSNKGPIVCIFNQYAIHGKDKTIHSSLQLRSFLNDINDIPKSLPGGKQQLTTSDGFVIPLAIRDGLCYMDMRPPTDEELDTLPHVIMTSDDEWNTTSMDSEPDESEFLDAVSNEHDIDEWVECNDQYDEEFSEDELNLMVCLQDVASEAYRVCMGAVKPPRKLLPQKPNFGALRKFFNWASDTKIEKTLRATTQWFRLDKRLPMRRHVKSRFPAANVKRWNEEVSTDVFFSDTPAHDDGIPGHGGCTMAQLYVGNTSHYKCLYPIKSEKEFPETLRQLITDKGAPISLRSDYAKAQQSSVAKKILRDMIITQSFSEPYNQQQNPAERQVQEVKKEVNTLMDRTGTPAQYWLLCTLFIVYLSNLMSLPSLNWLTPTEVAFGYKPDISSILHFSWWEPVYYLDDDGGWPSHSKEKLGRWVGVAENVGDVLTWWILTEDTKQVIPRSVVRSALDKNFRNLRAMNPEREDPLEIIHDDNSESVDGEEMDPVSAEEEHKDDDIDGLRAQQSDNAANNFRNYIWSSIDTVPGVDPADVKLPRFSIEEIMDRTFLVPQPDGRRLRAEIVHKINDQDAQNHQRIKLLCKVGDGGAEQILTYQEICDLIDEQDAEESKPDKLWTFKRILSHEGPLNPSDPKYKGSQYNVRILWEDDSITDEPLKVIAKDDPITVAQYAHAKGLLDTPGWKHF